MSTFSKWQVSSQYPLKYMVTLVASTSECQAINLCGYLSASNFASPIFQRCLRKLEKEEFKILATIQLLLSVGSWFSNKAVVKQTIGRCLNQDKITPNVPFLFGKLCTVLPVFHPVPVACFLPSVFHFSLIFIHVLWPIPCVQKKTLIKIDIISVSFPDYVSWRFFFHVLILWLLSFTPRSTLLLFFKDQHTVTDYRLSSTSVE